jgi:hypothetical protein
MSIFPFIHIKSILYVIKTVEKILNLINIANAVFPPRQQKTFRLGINRPRNNHLRSILCLRPTPTPKRPLPQPHLLPILPRYQCHDADWVWLSYDFHSQVCLVCPILYFLYQCLCRSVLYFSRFLLGKGLSWMA